MSITTIRISTKLRDELKEMGKKGESYEDIISRMITQNKKMCTEKGVGGKMSKKGRVYND